MIDGMKDNGYVPPVGKLLDACKDAMSGRQTGPIRMPDHAPHHPVQCSAHPLYPMYAPKAAELTGADADRFAVLLTASEAEGNDHQTALVSAYGQLLLERKDGSGQQLVRDVSRVAYSYADATSREPGDEG